MNEFINVITNNGTAIAMLVYFVYRDNKFNQTLQSTLNSLDIKLNEVIKTLDKKRGDK